ncbi:thiol reductant ABC exporter subunit CydC [Oceanobacillus profundus]|uniref:Thiol reductant ABC exporter subunit CydC n=1 Tax=Oceanobacillus profundus TaxID=372463 RepID=A0A417YLI8_9BACI|nr:thiol reductant ABC exporter subunit CydC [Oceanobacillus profundus]MBR3120634.1 thiol reductant ABC exporter subunit CydC [Oceanobacillus sp.]MCM3399283.1 thiol reductant ABC exporter subunit CydC [Oceanobacillus profundus]MDO6450361.1 thiol reductant ABC exporter subunit CydC [Oceanobacillus profundus]RHW34254.1 thiol reductant ABC exporter subunit CydC [Oceanobacillus profundus]
MKGLRSVIKIVLQEKKDVIFSIACGFLAGVTAVGLFSSSGYLISKAALVPPIYSLMVLVAIVKLLGIISALSRYGERYFSHRATFTMLSNLRVSFYKKMEPLAPTIFQSHRSGDLLARIVGDVESLQNYFLRVFYPPIVLVLVFLVTILFTAYFSIEAALLLLLGLLLTTLVVPLVIGMKQRKIDYRVRSERGNLSTEVTEFLYGFRDLKIYQQVDDKEEALLKSADTYLLEQERENVHRLFSESANTFLSLLVSVSVLTVSAYFVSVQQLDGLFLAMLVMISLTLFENTSPMAAFPSYLQESRQAVTRLDEVMERKGNEDDSFETLQIKRAPSITFHDVSFAFPTESRDTLKDLTFHLPAGSKTAIVGPSGSGKSTIMQLLLKLYQVRDGAISLNDQSVADLKAESIWEHANVMLQSNHFFYGTIRDNLAISQDGLADREMEDILFHVQLNHFGLDDQVLEKGENLSGGEKQRLALARILLKQAPLWLLDEPTSSIDALTEEQLYKRLFEVAENDTVVLISHRLTGLEKMDQIIVMDQGEIAEAGTFEELMKSKGYFYQMKKIEQSVFLADL